VSLTHKEPINLFEENKIRKQIEEETSESDNDETNEETIWRRNNDNDEWGALLWSCVK